MSSAQIWMAAVLLCLVVGRLYQANSTDQDLVEALLNFGGPAVLAAAAGGLRILMAQAGVLRGVTSIPKGSVVSEGDRFGVADLTQFGDRLLADAIYVYIVFALVLVMVFFERRWGASSREAAPLGFSGWTRYIGLGYLLPGFIGAFALYLIYTVS